MAFALMILALSACNQNPKKQPVEKNDTLSAKQIAERPADKNQRAQEESVRLDHPLYVHHGRVKAGLEHRQSDIYDRAID